MVRYGVLLSLNVTILVLYVINFVVWIVFLTLPSLPSSVALVSITDAVYFLNNTDINLPSWAFAIWAAIYLWQLLWIVFSFRLTFTFRRLGPPVLLTPTFLGLFVLGLLLQIGVTVAGRFVTELTFALILLQSIILFVCFILVHNDLFNNLELLKSQNRLNDDLLIRALVHNGVGIYMSWVIVLVFLNIIVLVNFRSQFDLQDTITVVLVFLGLFRLISVILDYVFDRLLRYTFTTFIVGMWLSSAIVTVAFGRNLVIIAVYLGLNIVEFVSKIVFVVIQSFDNPLYPIKK